MNHFQSFSQGQEQNFRKIINATFFGVKGAVGRFFPDKLHRNETPLASNSALLLELGENVFNLLFCESLVTAGTLVDFIGESVIDKLVGKIDLVETHGKIIDPGELFVKAAIANKIIPHGVHLPPSYLTKPHMYSLFSFISTPYRKSTEGYALPSVQAPPNSIRGYALTIRTWVPSRGAY
jgi:hypothetical protein